MNRLIERLSRKETDFTVEYRGFGNVWEIMADKLLANPGVLASLQTFGCSSLSRPGGASVRVSAVYEPESAPVPVFLIKDSFDLLTAAALAQRLHLEKTKVVVDNRSGRPFAWEYFSEAFSRYEEAVGEEFAPHQLSSYRRSCISYLDNRIIVYTCCCKYFDSAERVNAVKCAAALQAGELRKHCGSGGRALIGAVLQWLKRNVTYVDNNRSDDHSAVGLFVNRTAVCQGIAVYAYLLLLFCGIPVRVVFGDADGRGGWGAHAWNAVRLDGAWTHIDYTFALERDSVFEEEASFRRNHRWDEIKYGAARCDEINGVRNTLKRSVITVIPETACFAVNSCILDTSRSLKLCVSFGNVLCVAADFFFRFCGGCCSFSLGKAIVAINEDLYILPLSSFIRSGERFYLPVIKLRELGFSVKVEGACVVLQR